MNPLHTEQTPLLGTLPNQDKGIKQYYHIWWKIVAGILVFVFAVILALSLNPFDTSDESIETVPSKIVIKDSKVRIQLGVLGRREQNTGNKGDITSKVVIESTKIDTLMIHVDEAKVFPVAHDFGHSTTGGNRRNEKETIEEEKKESVLMLYRAKSATGTFLNFFISSSFASLHSDNSNIKGHGQQKSYNVNTSKFAGRLSLRIIVPYEFEGELTIDGTNLNIEGSPSLVKTRFNLLHFATEEGDIIFRKHGTASTDLPSMVPLFDYGYPTLQTAHFYARVYRKGSILVESMKSAQRGKPVRVNIETQEGDITIGALQPMLQYDSEKEYPDADEVVNYFNLLTHRGDINMCLNEAERLFGPWYIRGQVVVKAEALTGSIRGQVEIPDLQLLYLDVVSYKESILKVAEKFEGELTVMSSPQHNATVIPYPNSKHVLKLDRSQTDLKKGRKVRLREEYLPIGNIHAHAKNGSASVTFFEGQETLSTFDLLDDTVDF
ncbi:hypothetical protein FBU30_006947 [Linnemannia zychae]|nr:hypothetical protein FBU30_006947 [Linnemannia zychae]